MSKRPSGFLAAVMCCAVLVSGTGCARSESRLRGKAEHVVLVVWDGMRPDFVTEANSPTLWKLAQSGVTFRRHHSVYPSLTTVNSTALATGVFPNHSGMISNYDYRPEIGTTKIVRMDAFETIRKGDEAHGGQYLTAPTIAELVQANGGRTAVTGTKTAGLLHDRKARANSSRSVTIFDGQTLPESALAGIVKLLGPFPPESDAANEAEDTWTAKALTQSLWSDGVPEFSLLWMSNPDRAQHATYPGSEAALNGIKAVDADLAIVLDALEKKGVREKTDIFVVSDHGFSTVEHPIAVAAFLRTAGFTVASESDKTLERGAIRIAGNGGTNLFYVGEHDPATSARLVEQLQQSDFAGVIFSRAETAGAFPLSQIHIDTAGAPDAVMSFRWNDRENIAHVAGLIDANGTVAAGKGTHGTLSPFDIHNTLIAAGPDFRSGISSETPSANVDVAPTILHILGIKPPRPLDGRILAEAMIDGSNGTPTVETKTIESTREFPATVWRQYLHTSKVGSSVYFDEGNGTARAK